MGGKEWYWAGRSSKRGTGGGADHQGAETETTTPSSGCMCAVFQFFDFHPFHFPTINQQQESPFKSASTCISEDHTTTVPKGAEAPRNSLESEDGTASLSFLKEEDFKIPKNIQIKTSGSNGGNLNNDLSTEISSSPGAKTPTLVARLMGLDLLPGANSPSSSCLSAPNPQGNNINIPRLHHLRTKQHSIQTKPRNSTDSSDIAATRSLPETPRISSARRSDVDHHRLSLQINKENMMMVSLGEEDLELPHHRFSFSKRKCHENNIISRSSPSHYARQIVKQVKESVSRKVGQDITNTNNNNLKSREQPREEFAGQFRVKKSPKTSSWRALDESSSPGKQYSNPSSCSPRLSRFMDTKHSKPSTTTPSPPLTPKDQNTHPNVLKLPPPPPPHPVVNNTQPQLPRVLTKPKPQALPEPQQESSWDHKSVPKCKKATNGKFRSRLKRPPQTSDIIRNKQEESFIIRPTSPTRANDFQTTKSKKKTQPLSSNLLNNINTVPNLLPVKTDPSPPSTKIPQKQSQVSDTQESKLSSQLSSCSSQRYKQEGTSTLATREISINNTEEDKLNGASFTTGAAEHHTTEFQYITEILNRTNALTKQGTTTTATVFFFNQWFSPLDPSIFHHLESPNNDKDRNFTPKNQLGHRWNRRLLFDLVDEVLKEILRPKVSAKRLWFLHGFCYQGRSIGELTERVWKRVGEFPCAKCEVLDDIDMLIEAEDMEKVDVEGEEEGEGLVAEIEGNILDTLVHETVMVMDCPGISYFKISSHAE